MAATAQGAPQTAANGVQSHDHTRKPSVVISATGTSGYTANGAPVGQNTRPPINFGMMNSMGSSPNQQSTLPVHDQASNLQTPSSDNPRVISPAHSPSPIPQPNASGGRPPSSLQNQGNGLNFGSMGGAGNAGDGSSQGHPQNPSGQFAANAAQMHERRLSSQSMHSSDSSMGRGFSGPQAGRGRGGFGPGFNPMGSPAQNFRQISNQGRPAMNPQFSSGNLPPNAQYGRPQQRQQGSPHVGYVQPQAPYGAGYPQQMYAQGYDPYSGYFQPYTHAQYPYGAPGPSPSPRPQYPNPYANASASNQPPFMPPNMARTPSQASDRPGSSIGHPGTPNQAHAAPSLQQGSSNQQSASAAPNIVRPAKKSSAIRITNEKGEAVTFTKPAQSPAQTSQKPAATTTPVPPTPPPPPASQPTPPPRVPSAQHARSESKSVMSQDETREAFKEQVKRQMEAQRTEQDGKSVDGEAHDSAVKSEPVKEALAGAENAAAAGSGDKSAEKDADNALKTVQETEEERKTREKREDDERLEREIAEMEAEMEAKEREEEEREKAYQEKKKREKEENAKKEAERSANADEEMKRQEREAEEREAQRERERESGKASQETDDDAKALFASLKRPTLGPGADAGTSTPQSGDETPSEDIAPESATATDSTTAATSSTARGATSGAAATQKQRPANLKLETNRKVEPAEPTPGMQSLKSARFLELKEEALYPEGIKSPNPALNANGTKKARAYDRDFLLQFQNVFKEKPSVDWDQKVRDTLGPGDDSRPQSARTPSSGVGRSASSRGAQGASNFGGAMGNFASLPGGRTLPAGTTSEQRFLASQGGPRMAMPAQIARLPSNMGMGGNMGLNRTNSLQAMGPGSPRQPSSRGGKGASKRDNRQPSKKEEAEMANRMPLTAGIEVKALEKSSTGWTASSISQGPMANAPTLDGHMAPDLVQRKVKAALNKMTPEKFEKISDQILEIASQSKNESDGRTLRQVIQLTFEKACDEAHWAGMYAQFCHKMLTTMSQEIRDETIKDKTGAPVVGGALFRKYLLNRCQEDFERGWQVNLPDKPEGESQEAALLSDEYYVAAAAKRKGLGLIQFIGQLYKLGMLTIRIMHQCVMRLLNFEGDPDEAAVENLTTLLKSVGATMDADQQQGRALVDTYFARIEEKIMNNAALASRPKFMVMDLIDLRKSGWQGKEDAKGPKTITQIHQEAEAAQAKAELERQRSRANAGRAGGGRQDSRNFSGQMAPPIDYARTNVSTDDLKRLQNRSQRHTGGGLGPGGNLGPSGLGARTGSRRGNLGPSGSGNSTRTSTPPVGEKDKKEESAQQNSFSALQNLEIEEVESPEANRDRSKSPLPASSKADEA